MDQDRVTLGLSYAAFGFSSQSDVSGPCDFGCHVTATPAALCCGGQGQGPAPTPSGSPADVPVSPGGQMRC